VITPVRRPGERSIAQTVARLPLRCKIRRLTLLTTWVGTKPHVDHFTVRCPLASHSIRPVRSCGVMATSRTAPQADFVSLASPRRCVRLTADNSGHPSHTPTDILWGTMSCCRFHGHMV
jgi:hypothetical protein